jgi:hypothetical protein
VAPAGRGRRRPGAARVFAVVVALVAAVASVGSAPVAVAADTADLVKEVRFTVVLDAQAAVGVVPQPDTPTGTTYTYVWADETGELARTTTTDTLAMTVVGRAKFGRTFTATVTAVAPDGRTETATSAPLVATRWQVGGIAYDESSRQFQMQLPHLPAQFEAELGAVSVTYHWLRSGTAIAPDPSLPGWVHARAAADEGHTLSVSVESEQAATGASSVWSSGTTPPVGVVKVALTIEGTVASGQSVQADVRTLSWYPTSQSVAPQVTCDGQWYRNGTALYGRTGLSHYIHTMERSTTVQANVRCSSPGYLPINLWTAKLAVPGSPALVSLWNGDALRELCEFQPWFDTLMMHAGRLATFDLGNRFSTSVLPTRSVNSIALAGDLDDDGRENLVARDTSGALWSYSSGQTRVRIGASGWNAMNLLVAGGDFTGDRMADLFARRSTGELVFYPGRGRQGLGAGRVVAASAFRYAKKIVTIGDANGDGRADLHVSWANGDLSFYAGRGDGTFASPVRVGTGWGSMTRLLAGRDLDRDGKADLLALDPAGRLWLYPGNGKGGFTARSLTNPGHPLGTGIY